MSNMNLIAISNNGTKVYEHPEAHPHRMDLATEGIGKMIIPERPADPSDRTQTRVAATVDLGREIGKNHLVETSENDTIIMFNRGRGYKSRMVLKEAKAETRLTSVCFWDSDNNCWVLWTNFEGEEGLPEPGCDRYNNAPVEFKAKCDEFWSKHALVPTFEEGIEILKENDTDIDDIINNEKADYWRICFEDLSDVGPYGGYPDFAEENTVEKAVETAICILGTGADVYDISAC